MIRLALQQGWSRSTFDALYDRAVAAEPGYLSFYFNRAAYLRSYGEGGEWEAYALDTAHRNTSGEGLGIYSRIAWSLSEGFADDYLAKWTAIRWPVMRDGFRELDQHWPNSDWNLNNFCRYACLAGDRDTARELFARIGDRWTTNWLSHKSFLEWQTWANAQEQPASPPAWRFASADPDHPLAWTIHFAPDGTSLFAGYDHARVVRWDLRTGQATWRGDLGRDGSVDGLAVSPDGRWLAAGVGSRNRAPNVPGAVALWDLRTSPLPPAPMRRLGDGQTGVHNLRFSADGRLLVAAGYNQIVDPGGELRVWTVADWQELRHDSFRLNALGVALLGPTGQQLAFAASKSFDVVDTVTGAHVFWPDQGLHATFVSALSASPDGKSLACVTHDGYTDRDRPGELTVWNTADWTRRDAPHVTTAGGLAVVAYSPDGKRLAAGGYDGILRLWDAGTGQTLAAWPPEATRARSTRSPSRPTTHNSPSSTTTA